MREPTLTTAAKQRRIGRAYERHILAELRLQRPSASVCSLLSRMRRYDFGRYSPRFCAASARNTRIMPGQRKWRRLRATSRRKNCRSGP
jgi:hypothetical protein